jgi:hypothetical protein
MLRSFCRLILAVVMAFAIVFPPVSDAFACALGGNGEHAHYDHIWHQPGVADADHEHDRDQAGKTKHSCLDHIHMAVMALPDGSRLTLDASYRVYDVAVSILCAGRVLVPPGHPPQRLA